MKKNLLFIIALFVATSMSAQFYAGLGVGYGIGANQQIQGTEVDGTIQTNLYGSYGQGFTPNLKLGFMFNKNLGVELGVGYLFGAMQTKYKNESADRLVEAKSSGMRIAPQLVYKLNSGFYSRFGLIIPIFGTTVATDTDNKHMAGITMVQKVVTQEFKGSFSIGFIGAIGYAYALNDNLSIFGEVEYVGLSIKSGTSTITQYDVGGVDGLPTLTTSQKETEYKDKIDPSTDNTNPSIINGGLDEPTVKLKTRAPFSSLGINFGIIMTF